MEKIVGPFFFHRRLFIKSFHINIVCLHNQHLLHVGFSMHVTRFFLHGSGSFQHVSRFSIYRTTCPRAKKDLLSCILFFVRVVLKKTDLLQTKELVCKQRETEVALSRKRDRIYPKSLGSYSEVVYISLMIGVIDHVILVTCQLPLELFTKSDL